MIYALALLAAVILAACFALAVPAWIIGRIGAAVVRFLTEEER